MEVDTASSEIDSEQASGGSRKERSTIRFPYGDLKDAEAVAQAVFREGGTVTLDRLAPSLGHDTVNSGTFVLKVSTAQIFGLIDRARGGTVSLTDLGHRIVNAETANKARVDAFLGVDLYKRVYEEYSGKLLPPDTGIDTFMKRQGVAEKQASKARQAMRRSAESAGFFQMGKDRLVTPNVGASAAVGVQKNGGKGDDSFTPPVDERPLHPAVAGMLEGLPRIGEKWTEVAQKEWIDAFGQVLRVFHKASSSSVSTETELPSSRSQNAAQE